MDKIPKIIHYCWFGPKKVPRQLRKYIRGWHEKLPDYKFVCWSEKNFNWRRYSFTRKEYLKHNWAFVSDYVRLYVLYRFGGIYLDTDVEVLKSLDPLLNNELFMGLEDWNSISSGLIFGSIPYNKNIRNIIRIYNRIGKKRNISNYYNTVNIITLYFRKYGLKYKNKKQCVNGCNIYPTCYFCPKRYGTDIVKLNRCTYTIHHYTGSWIDEKISSSVMRHIKESNYIKKIIGPTLYRKLYKYYLYVKNIKNVIF